ncbi:MAG: hypothetical protein K2M76_03885, partial [Muribaculaceae bacterium]|nr:hypothetical protein [Muribaculaceae bacterium]
MECKYDESTFGQIVLERIEVSNDDKAVFRADLEHGSDWKLLSSINIPSEGTYSFEYNPTKFDYNNGMDWWGYYNGKNNDYLSPPINKYEFNYRVEFPGADRSVDREKIKAYILTKVTYPTGGSAEWEYETHRFPEQIDINGYGYQLQNEISLSEGGGVRVKSITLREHLADHNPRVKHYTYGSNGDGLAQIAVVPFLHTFLSETRLLNYRYYASTSFNALDFYLTVNRFSDYLTGQTGCTPIWYDKVTETDSEGKTEYEFENLCPENVVEREFWRVWPVEVNTAFSKGPVQTSFTRYKSTESGYTPIEKTELTHRLVKNTKINQVKNFTVHRNNLFCYTEFAPDYGPVRTFFLEFKDHIIVYDRDAYNPWFTAYDYIIHPQTEQLVSKTTTTYLDNGNITRTEQYEYVPGTTLLSATVVSNSTNSLRTEYSYTDSCSPTIAQEMRERNICGMVTGVKEVYGSATASYSMELGKFGNTFRPVRIWQKRDGAKWTNATYSYTPKGYISKLTTASGSVRTWTWDSYGHPLTATVGNSLTNTAEWEHLVGLKSLTSPSGTRQDFNYDGYGRLCRMALNSRTQERYEYRIDQDGNNYVKTQTYVDAYSPTTGYARFDGLGRQWSTMSLLPDNSYIMSMTEFDRMGRVSRQWSPVSVSSPTATASSVSSVASEYYDDAYAYTSCTYEASQRELPVSTTKSGKAWHDNAKMVSTKIQTNDASGMKCTHYTVTASGVKSNGNYQPAVLTVERTVDEDGITLELYKDFRGLTVCRKQGDLITDYVYNDFGDLCYILPPALSGTHSRSDAEMQKYAYWYDYDSRGRLISNKLPGIREWKYIYDPADRLVAERTPHHPTSQWRLYGYDSADRQVLALDCTMTESQARAFGDSCRTVVPATGALCGYTMESVPPLSTVVWAKYYDDYQFIQNNGLSSDYYWSAPAGTVPAYNEHSVSSAGQLTGVYTGQGYEAYHYNTDGQIMQSYATGFNRGLTNTFYTYSGKVSEQTTVADKNSRTPELKLIYSYDNIGRQTKMEVEHLPDEYISTAPIDTMPMFQPVRLMAIRPDTTTILPADPLIPVLPDSSSLSVDTKFLAKASVGMSYNSIGQLGTLALGDNCTLNHTYDVHGWLKGSIVSTSKTSMGETLHYADSSPPRYNGNLSSR